MGAAWHSAYTIQYTIVHLGTDYKGSSIVRIGTSQKAII